MLRMEGKSLTMTWKMTLWKTKVQKYGFSVISCILAEIPNESVSSTGRAGAKGADAKKNVKKCVVAKPNTIKRLFMNSNVKRPAEVRWHACSLSFRVLT